LLLRLIAKRFGPVGDDAQRQIMQANTEQLESWADKLLDASSLAEVFGPH
jgi:hypothetical protein